MSTIDDGGPAFPCGGVEFKPEPGMSRRDYFAGAAQNMVSVPIDEDDWDGNAKQAAIVARWSYLMADAMIAASKATAPTPEPHP